MTEAQEEKELILGNKQLISLFFVVVALCGVCFAMGYIIGHNSSKPQAPADAGQSQPPPRSQEQEPARETPDPSTPSSAPQDSSAAQPPDASAAPATQPANPASDQVVTQPVRDVPRTEPPSDPAPAPAVTAPQPGGGSYLQVGAVSKVDAENLVRTLREQKLPALMAESPRKGLYRVLVGPYHQTADLADAKSRLKTLGFDNAFVQK